jgi:hypothetical protein
LDCVFDDNEEFTEFEEDEVFAGEVNKNEEGNSEAKVVDDKGEAFGEEEGKDDVCVVLFVRVDDDDDEEEASDSFESEDVDVFDCVEEEEDEDEDEFTRDDRLNAFKKPFIFCVWCMYVCIYMCVLLFNYR